MDNLLYNILLPPFIHSLIHSIVHSLIYTLIYTTQPRTFYTTLIYSIIHSIIIYTLLYTPLYTLLYSLLFSNNIINLAPAVLYFPSRSYVSYILAPLIFIFVYSHIVIPTLLYRKGITMLPPIFTRFISLS